MLSDGTNSSGISLACQDWGNSEGCGGNSYDNHDMIDTGADGQTWYRHPIAIPANLDRSKLVITIRHQQDSWDGSSAESTIYYDLVTDNGRDVIPDAFSFTSQIGVPLSTVVESNTITVTGINAPAAISITGGEYSVSSNGGGTWTPYSATDPATVSLNDQVKVHQTTSSSYATTTTATLTIGGRSGTFSVTTIPITLTITKDGTGSGTVTTNKGGINCGSTCSAVFATGDSADISAAASTDSFFKKWGGDTCSGNATQCSLTMDSPKTVTATFNLKTDFSATPKTGYAPLAVQFTDSSMDGTGEWFWSFGDGGSSTEQNPMHMYRSAGTYDVALTANGMTTTKVVYIVVDTGCANDPIKIYGTMAHFTKLSDAFVSALADNDVLEAQAFNNPDSSLTYANPHAVTLRGGYDCGFTVNPDFTTVNGNMTITGGTLTIDKLQLR